MRQNATASTTPLRIIRLGASDYDRILEVWIAAGLTIKPDGRDAREAFERQMVGAQQIVLGCEADAGDLIAVVLPVSSGPIKRSLKSSRIW